MMKQNYLCYCLIIVWLVGGLIGSPINAFWNNEKYVEATRKLKELVKEELENPGKYSMKEIRERHLKYMKIAQTTYYLSDEPDRSHSRNSKINPIYVAVSPKRKRVEQMSQSPDRIRPSFQRVAIKHKSGRKNRWEFLRERYRKKMPNKTGSVSRISTN